MSDQVRCWRCGTANVRKEKEERREDDQALVATYQCRGRTCGRRTTVVIEPAVEERTNA